MESREVEKDMSKTKCVDRVQRLVEIMGRVIRPGMFGLAVAAVVAFSPAGESLAAKLISSRNSPAQGHAQVIAQGVSTLDKGNLVWRVTQDQAGTKAETTTQPSTGFVLTELGEVVIYDRNGKDGKRLAEGEALYLANGKEHSLQSNGEESADYFEIQIAKANEVDSDALFQSDSFAGLKGARDIDLVRDVLEDDDETVIPDSDVPVLIVVTGGELQVKVSGEKDAITLKDGEAATFDGELIVAPADDVGGTFVAAVVGPEVNLPQSQPAQTPKPQPTAESDVEQTPPAGSVPVDGDEDGLEDVREPEYGTNPAVQDTDQDGLRDGDEVYIYGTDPTIVDTDVDGISDYDEIIHTDTDPVVKDSDADGLIDGQEILETGTAPTNPDTDADGISDGDEVNIHLTNPLTEDSDEDGVTDFYETFTSHTDPNNPDADGDGINDSDEIFTYVGLDPLNPDSDGDGLVDGDEMPSYGSSPTMADTDGDGVDDGTEVNAGTDPADATSHP